MRVTKGRVHADRWYRFDELPAEEQARFAGLEDHEFARVRYGKGKRARFEYVPAENFIRLHSGRTGSGAKAHGWASDSFYSGTAILIIPEGSGSECDYQVWWECC